MGSALVNRAGEMEVFVRVVEQGGFTAAARALRLSPSAVSKLVARLEARLGARLIARSTRKLQLTPEGAAFHERALRILAELDEAERSTATGGRPVGRIRVNTNASYGNHVLAPLVPAFRARYPEVALVIVQTDAVVDLIEARTDVAIRAGPLPDSSLIARKLGTTGMMLVAAPAYLERHGIPAVPADLAAHERLGFCYARAVAGWPLLENGQRLMVPPPEGLQASNGEALRHLAVAGAGIVRLAAFTVQADIAKGRLVPVLQAYRDPDDVEEVHAVYLGQRGLLPVRVRALLDFLVEHGRVG